MGESATICRSGALARCRCRRRVLLRKRYHETTQVASIARGFPAIAEAESPNRVQAATVNAADGPENVSTLHDQSEPLPPGGYVRARMQSREIIMPERPRPRVHPDRPRRGQAARKPI